MCYMYIIMRGSSWLTFSNYQLIHGQIQIHFQSIVLWLFCNSFFAKTINECKISHCDYRGVLLHLSSPLSLKTLTPGRLSSKNSSTGLS